MSLSSAEKWDRKYADADLNTPVAPCYVLKQHSRLLPFKGLALDLASGLGGNARFLSQCGLKVEAWDISDQALTILNNWASLNHLPIAPLLTDLDQMLFPYQRFDVIVVSRFLNRQLFQQIEQALKPGGLLFYQTFLGPVYPQGIQNADFYLQSGELIKAFPSLRVQVYGEGWLASENSLDQENKQRYSWLVGKKT
ncbi:class I SAM-dependent methyltransferase [Thiomicrorhabdus heinhorstiae]|uniref:Class I SAM-dependent methyltransferase n=1 Tax=Thiomicrorhabdus heinhorstiae TaxID=2748010 RepID=A0ABS0BUK6_9GAMM|nr:class I SAM-dependent methyltransferase [Thiomicrorhabdus heinhorstiae]MBF6057522.1 class I SAM-dependent methyltransferase [Thiomicrorhabdus heinhorstiae]